MSLKLEQKLNQRLAISQKMRQSLSLLSLSNEEIEQAINQELLENPLLEPKDEAFLSDEKPHEALGFSLAQGSSGFYSSLSHSIDKKSPSLFIENCLSEPISLKSHLLKQAEMSCLPDNIKQLLPLLLTYLDDRAYLTLDLVKIASIENLSLSPLQQALSALQSFEPAGVGGRNLKECLLIQLRAKKEDTRKAQLIVESHLTNIKEKKFKVIAFDLDISLEETLKHCQKIQSLQPNPGVNFSSQPVSFVRPDIYILKRKDQWQVLFNQEHIPELRLSNKYESSLKRLGKLKPAERKYFQEKSSSAWWFIQALKKRKEKITQIAHYLIQHQTDFFEKGADFLKPLSMGEMAKALNTHISTISRAINNKHAFTSQGLLPLRMFFQKGLLTKEGEAVSQLRVKTCIKSWIEGEDPENPLSDRQIQEKIYQKFHLSLLRRSVSAYRDSLNIPPLNSRKRAFRLTEL